MVQFMVDNIPSPFWHLILTIYMYLQSIQHYVIKFVKALRQVGGFLRLLRFYPPMKLTATI